MPKSVSDAVLDAALDVIASGCDLMTLTEGEPLSFAEANTAKSAAGRMLASFAMTAADFAISDGLTSGRRVSVAAKTDAPVGDSGTADHVALLDTVNGRLLFVTTMTSQVLTAGNLASTSAFDIEIRDPA
ncbi:MAG: hypothetical protein D6757_01015 [Alphaproteobacteria bacterium]|nr:MAG: hypothetical protein D6757_01015 [Alphaproteobacteria bacterium]